VRSTWRDHKSGILGLHNANKRTLSSALFSAPEVGPTRDSLDIGGLDGGGYFGVPYGNFLRWIFTVYALYLSKQDPASVHTVTDKAYWYQVACLLLVIALHYQADFIGRSLAS
jgi:hypothetical protein